MPSQEERRQYIRLDASLVVSYQLSKNETGFDLTQTKNISQGGAVFNTNQAYQAGQIIKLILRLPFTLEKVEINAEVVDSQNMVAGGNIYATRVKFLDLPQEHFEQLGQFITKKHKQ